MAFSGQREGVWSCGIYIIWIGLVWVVLLLFINRPGILVGWHTEIMDINSAGTGLYCNYRWSEYAPLLVEKLYIFGWLVDWCMRWK
jgi:hypothetical protein